MLEHSLVMSVHSKQLSLMSRSEWLLDFSPACQATYHVGEGSFCDCYCRQSRKLENDAGQLNNKAAVYVTYLISIV